MNPPLFLVGTRPNLPLLRLPAAGGVYLLGRSPPCELIVDDMTVSRRHAEVKAADQRIEVRDLGSRNGTFVNGMRVSETAVTGDAYVRFGRAEFRLVMETTPERAHAEPLTTHTRGPKEDERETVSLLGALSAAERKVFDLLASDKSEKQIAAQLDLSPNTVHNHVRVIYRKAGVRSRGGLLARFIDVEDDE